MGVEILHVDTQKDLLRHLKIESERFAAYQKSP